MNRPRKYYGWQDGDKFKVSLWPRTEKRAANTYDTKEDAEADAQSRKDRANPAPTIEWESE